MFVEFCNYCQNYYFCSFSIREQTTGLHNCGFSREKVVLAQHIVNF